MTDEQAKLVEAMAIRLAKAADQAILEAGDASSHCESAYRAGAGPSVSYWDALAIAALTPAPKVDVVELLREARGMITGDIEYGLEGEAAFLAKLDTYLASIKESSDVEV